MAVEELTVACWTLRCGYWAVLLLIASLVGCSAQSAANTDGETLRVTINGRTFNLELALDDDARYLGLGHRDHIAADGGMLFVFPMPRQTSFVMRDCLVPIDLIFLGPRGEVLSTHRMKVEPPETRANPARYYASHGYAQFAIELAGGTLDQLKLQRGDRIELPFDALKARAQ